MRRKSLDGDPLARCKMKIELGSRGHVGAAAAAAEFRKRQAQLREDNKQHSLGLECSSKYHTDEDEPAFDRDVTDLTKK